MTIQKKWLQTSTSLVLKRVNKLPLNDVFKIISCIYTDQ